MVNICRIFSLQIHPITLSILVPVGISFYTFQAMSYVIDVYRAGGTEQHYGVYATFISVVCCRTYRTNHRLAATDKNRKEF